jgi:hypothetical protein
MSNDVEILVRSAAPRVTRQPDAFLAALSVSDEAAGTVESLTRKRRRTATAVGVAAVIALAGTNVAAATTRSLWWSAPHEVVAEAKPLTDDAGTATLVRVILAADYAPGADPGSTAAREAFRLSQSWLAEHPVLVDVPDVARTLTAEEETRAIRRGIPPQVALEHKVIAATERDVNAAVEDAYETLRNGLGAHLADHGIDSSLIVIDRDNGLVEVDR